MRHRELLERIAETERQLRETQAELQKETDRRVIAELHVKVAEARVERGVAAVHLARGQTNSLTQAHAQLTTILNALATGPNHV